MCWIAHLYCSQAKVFAQLHDMDVVGWILYLGDDDLAYQQTMFTGSSEARAAIEKSALPIRKFTQDIGASIRYIIISYRCLYYISFISTVQC